jgi:hypothetical protein
MPELIRARCLGELLCLALATQYMMPNREATDIAIYPRVRVSPTTRAGTPATIA